MTHQVEDEVNWVIQKATAKNPRHRYEQVLAFAADLRQAAQLSEDGRTALNIASQYGHAKAYQTLMAAKEMAVALESGMPADMLVRSLEQEEERQRHYG